MENREIISIDECRAIIQEFANRFKLIFDDSGVCGFGRECVGLTNGNNWLDYNPTSHPDYDYVEGFYDERLYDIIPKDAYHKHDCIAVLGRGDDAIRQLYDWIVRLNELGATVEKYPTGAKGFQAMISGTHNYAIKIPTLTPPKH
jgi:hypothetical protein